MTDAVSVTKLIAGGLAAGAAVPAAADAISKAEQVLPILGVSTSVLLVAIAGALIGVVLLPERDTEPHLLGKPVPAMTYMLQNSAVAHAMVAAIDAARASNQPLCAPDGMWPEPTELTGDGSGRIFPPFANAERSTT